MKMLIEQANHKSQILNDKLSPSYNDGHTSTE